MGGLIKLIKNFFSSIFSFLGGLVGGKKSIEGSAPKTQKGSGYFLELDEAESPKDAAVSKPTAETLSTSNAVAASSETTPTAKKQSSERSELLAAASSGSSTSVAKPPAAKAVAPKPEASVEFATKYLVPTSNGSRRRPGANMNSYLDMARNMNSN